MTIKKYVNNNTHACLNSIDLTDLDMTELQRSGIEFMFNKAIEAEVNEQLNSGIITDSKQAHLKERRTRNINTAYGPVTVEIPRFKDFKYYPRFLRPYERNDDQIKDSINDLTDRGLSTRAMEDHFKNKNISGLTRSTISRYRKRSHQQVEEFRSRRFDEKKYLNMMIDAFYVPVMTDGAHGKYSVDKAVIVTIGLNAETKKYEYLSIDIHPGESKDCIQKVLKSLKERGLDTRVIVTSDSGAGLAAGLQTEFVYCAWNPCQFHEVKTGFDRLGRQDREFREKALAVYHASTLEESGKKFEALEKEYKDDSHYAPALRSIKSSLSKGTPYREIKDEKVRKQIYTSNRLESYNGQNRRRLDPIRVFNSDESLYSYLIRFALKCEERWSRRESDLKDCPLEEYYSELIQKADGIYQKADEQMREFAADFEEITAKPDLVYALINYLPVLEGESQYSVPVLQLFGETDKKTSLLASAVLKDKNVSTIKQCLWKRVSPHLDLRKTLFIVPYSETELYKAIRSVFKTQRIKYDWDSFSESFKNYVPSGYKEEFEFWLKQLSFYEDYQAALEFSEIFLDILKFHHLNQAFEMLKEALDDLLTPLRLKIKLKRKIIRLKNFRYGSGSKCPGTHGLNKKPVSIKEAVRLFFTDW